jgi:hypothetical protein
MSALVKFEVDGQEIVFQTPGVATGELFAADASAVPAKAEKQFDAAIQMLRPLVTKFADILAATQVQEAEMSLGLKVTAKGDFIIVGTTGEASLNLKLKLAVK